MIVNLYETPTLINNEEYPFDTFWFWLTPEKPIGCHMHFHKEIEIIYVTTGSMDIWLDGKKMSDDSVYGSGSNCIEIDGGVGELNITFKPKPDDSQI